MLSEQDIQTELYTNTALTAGGNNHAKECTSLSEAETTACCDGLKYVKDREVWKEGDFWHCYFSDKGSGDWD